MSGGAFLNFEGNKFAVKQAIYAIDSEDHSRALQVMRSLRIDIGPRTIQQIWSGKGGPASAVHNPDLEKYQSLDESLWSAIKALDSSKPEVAKETLATLMAEFGWT